ncbi:Rieske (2Fe-2S) protein [Methanolobus sp. ZRKC3]|uniref:Rieske (2Fe-2S) protein n=1 Tax=Methanolobus sp. ZRKC3 TaxID=3125786 RepID=UPI0032459B89
MASWIIATNESELKEGEPADYEIGGKNILLIKKDGEIFALNNNCPHMNCPFTGGKLEDHTLFCPCHKWAFDIRTGEYLVAPRLKVEIYETKVEDGKVSVLV